MISCISILCLRYQVTGRKYVLNLRLVDQTILVVNSWFSPNHCNLQTNPSFKIWHHKYLFSSWDYILQAFIVLKYFNSNLLDWMTSQMTSFDLGSRLLIWNFYGFLIFDLFEGVTCDLIRFQFLHAIYSKTVF